ncbi:hypothetical protein [Streptomyces roseolilacinus]|uniref:hypothetical protein n=1 Tax=Streptomyces roseolilacinus TaxID=66904 RepID=UPI00380761DB
MNSDHLISDDETRQIAEGFLKAAHWLGDHEWSSIVIGPGAEYHRGFDGVVPADARLSEDQRWSWCVSFTDPAGARKTLSHEVILTGLSRIVYGESQGSSAFRVFGIKQWFTEPSEARRQLKLSPAEHSLICQRALYDKIVFPTGELFGQKPDMFSDQRSSEDTPADDASLAE